MTPVAARAMSVVMKGFVRIMAAARRGILKANPHALIISPDPENMAPDGGIRYLDTFLKAGGGRVCNIIGIHPYRTRPEKPDMDADAATLQAMLKRRHFTGPVWFDEGMDLPVYQLPVYDGMTVWREVSGDGFRCGTFSYGLGLGERVNAAYTARCWLVGFKYSRRVKMQVDWIFNANARLDMNGTPAAPAFVPNTLQWLLGNSHFLQDVKLGRDVRCYVFQDVSGRSVAVVWNYALAIDKGLKPVPLLRIVGLPHGTKIYSLMGNGLAPPANGWLPITRYPVFFRGPPGSSVAMIKALQQAEFRGANPLRMKFQTVSPRQGRLCVESIVDRPLAGELQVHNGTRILLDKMVRLAPGKTITVRVPLSGKGVVNWRSYHLQAEFRPSDGMPPVMMRCHPVVLLCHHISRPLKLDGRLADWPRTCETPFPRQIVTFAPMRPTIKPVHSKWNGPAVFYTAWNRRFFYVAVKIRDPDFYPANRAAAAWTGTSLQVYFHDVARCHPMEKRRWLTDNQSYELWPTTKGCQVIRETSSRRLPSGQTGAIKAVCWRTPGGMIYEAAFPARQILPMMLKPNATFGFALLINHNNGDYRDCGLSLTPAGTQPYQNPGLYPTMILVGGRR